MGVIEELGADVAAPEWLSGDMTQRREGLFHGGTDGWRLDTHLHKHTINTVKKTVSIFEVSILVSHSFFNILLFFCTSSLHLPI